MWILDSGLRIRVFWSDLDPYFEKKGLCVSEFYESPDPNQVWNARFYIKSEPFFQYQLTKVLV